MPLLLLFLHHASAFVDLIFPFFPFVFVIDFHLYMKIFFFFNAHNHGNANRFEFGTYLIKCIRLLTFLTFICIISGCVNRTTLPDSLRKIPSDFRNYSNTQTHTAHTQIHRIPNSVVDGYHIMICCACFWQRSFQATDKCALIFFMIHNVMATDAVLCYCYVAILLPLSCK